MKLILRQWFNEAFKSILKFKLLLKKHFSFSLKKKNSWWVSLITLLDLWSAAGLFHSSLPELQDFLELLSCGLRLRCFNTPLLIIFCLITPSGPRGPWESRPDAYSTNWLNQQLGTMCVCLCSEDLFDTDLHISTVFAEKMTEIQIILC